MSKLSQTMKMVSGSTTYNVGFYTTTSEATAYGTYGTANVGGTTCYYGLGTGASVATGSGVKTPLKVIKGSTTYYMLTKGNAELATYTLKLAATTNQTITLVYKNRNYTDSGYETAITKKSTSSAQSFTVRKGTTWTATIAAASGFVAGALSPGASGTVNAATTVSAKAATVSTWTVTLKLTKGLLVPAVTITYTNSSNTSVTSSTLNTAGSTTYAVKKGTTIKLTNKAGGFYVRIYQNSTFKTEFHATNATWTSAAISANTTFECIGYLSSYYDCDCDCSG